MHVIAKTIDNEDLEINQEELHELTSSLRGELITKINEHYIQTCQVWNAMIQHRPAFIVQAQGTADVVKAVQFAQKHRLLISIRGGGHNIAGRSIQDNVMLIDLSKMHSIHVYPKNSIAIVEPGATLADLDHETQAYGLAVPIGINSTTGIAGLTLGGGFGWLSRKYGMTVDHLLSVELVTVDGERIVCDKDTYPDLFWAIRGGGGNFGIITSFTFNLCPVGPEVIAGPLVFKFEDAKKVLQNYRAFCKLSPDYISTWCVLRNAPPLPFLDSVYHGKPVVILATLYTGPREESQNLLTKLRGLGNPIGDGIGPCQYSDFQRAFDPLLTPGLRNYWKSHNFKELSDGLFDTTIQYVQHLPSPHTEIFIAQMGGATNRVPEDSTAYPHRGIEFIMNVHTRWEHLQEDEKCISWARDYYKATNPFAEKGVYSNFVSEGDDNTQDAYEENLSRLRSIKEKYDPENILRSNLNITPM
jgi:FAD/FMN-containing dehydrogenase